MKERENKYKFFAILFLLSAFISLIKFIITTDIPLYNFIEIIILIVISIYLFTKSKKIEKNNPKDNEKRNLIVYKSDNIIIWEELKFNIEEFYKKNYFSRIVINKENTWMIKKNENEENNTYIAMFLSSNCIKIEVFNAIPIDIKIIDNFNLRVERNKGNEGNEGTEGNGERHH